jgi:hypothetical protein
MTDTRINDEVVASWLGWIVQITNRGGQGFAALYSVAGKSLSLDVWYM